MNADEQHRSLQAISRAKEKMEYAICQAASFGAPLNSIARGAGLSQQRVLSILRQREVDYTVQIPDKPASVVLADGSQRPLGGSAAAPGW